MNGKNKMIAWIAGTITVIILLAVLIVWMEPAKEGISRAEAYKALALVFADRQECESAEEQRQKSWFSDQEKDNWFVKYMDLLYEKGYLDPSLTPADLESAQKKLTYGEAAFAAEQISGRLKRQVGMNKGNREKPFPADQWWDLYRAILKEADPQGNVKEVEAILYGTPSNIKDAPSWTAYTTEGEYGFQGLALDAWLDHEIRFMVRGNEIAAVTAVESSDVVYRNIWLSQVKDGVFQAYMGAASREFTAEGKLAEEAKKTEDKLAPNLADLHMKDGRLTKVTVKKERIHGKILSVTDDTVEIEGYGKIPLDENFHVYKLYGDFSVLGAADILVGYDLQEFVAADGKLCAALFERPFDAKTIRVLLMDTGFKSLFHQSAEIKLNSGAEITYKNENGDDEVSRLNQGDVLKLTLEDERLQNGRMTIKPDGEEGITICSIERSQGQPVYSGSLEIKKESDGLVLINELYLEDYLKKVVPSEMPASYEKEALKAQAVCARTYAYRQIQGNTYGQYGAHVDDSTSFQVYNNITTSERTDQAVDETYGQMLFYNDTPIEAFYYSTSCGHGADGSVWGSGGEALPYLRSKQIKNGGRELTEEDNETFDAYIRSRKVTSYDAKYPMFRWQTELTAAQIGLKASAVGNVQDVTVTSRGLGGIAAELTVKGDQGTTRIKGQSAIRTFLGNEEAPIRKQDGSKMTTASLPSAFISIEKITDEAGSISFRIYGGGFGHGVGMSQNGAQSMAKSGKTYKDILDFFYQGAELKEN
jgi:stage II sporulation protein D